MSSSKRKNNQNFNSKGIKKEKYYLQWLLVVNTFVYSELCDRSLDYRFAQVPNARLGHIHARTYEANAAKSACAFYG